jgi:drug/metabolite transporter (DMT)-like permease
MSAGEKPLPEVPSPATGRLLVVGAAVFWSTSGAFTKVLTQNTWLHLNDPPVPPLTMAFYRVLFPALVLLPAIRRRDLAFRWPMVPTALVFAGMNALFVSAMAVGTAANAIFLQYTAPLWLYLASVWLLREPPDRRGAVAVVLGLIGVLVIAGSGMNRGELPVVALGLGSGIAYAGVLLGVRVLRAQSPLLVTVINQVMGALVLLPWVLREANPTLPQFVVLFFYGTVQNGVPYLLMAHGLRSVSPQEAGTLTLIEPIINPLWAYLVSPATESLSLPMFVGGCFIVGALAYRYWPRRTPAATMKPDG